MQTPIQALNILQQSITDNNFEFVPRKERSKAPVTSAIAKIIVANLTINDYVKVELDHDGSGDYLWFFTADDGIKYYIKFKILQQNRIKFLSFHEAEY